MKKKVTTKRRTARADMRTTLVTIKSACDEAIAILDRIIAAYGGTR